MVLDTANVDKYVVNMLNSFLNLLTLVNSESPKTELICDVMLRYD